MDLEFSVGISPPALEYVIPLPYGHHVFDEKLAVNCIVFLFAVSYFSPAAFKIFPLAFNHLSMLCLGVHLFVILTQGLLSFWDL